MALFSCAQFAISKRIQRLRNGITSPHAAFDIQSLYAQVHILFAEHIRHTYRLAHKTENNARLWNPGIEFPVTGPIQTWCKTWTKTNWANASGKLLIPKSILTIPGNRIRAQVIPRWRGVYTQRGM